MQAVVVEVNNTPWGEQTSYVESCENSLYVAGRWRFKVEKQMHVSPFMPMDVAYTWAMSAPGKNLSVYMANQVDGQRVFSANLALQRKEISSLSLATVLMRFPLQSLRVIVAIHWQALRLWMKRVPLYAHPDKQALVSEKA